MTREDAHIKCLSRDCKCVNGKDRDSNYHETIDKIFDYFENKTCENCRHKNEDGLMEYTCFECSRYYFDKWESKKW